METTVHRKCVIEFQVDNENNDYGAAGKTYRSNLLNIYLKKLATIYKLADMKGLMAETDE